MGWEVCTRSGHPSERSHADEVNTMPVEGDVWGVEGGCVGGAGRVGPVRVMEGGLCGACKGARDVLGRLTTIRGGTLPGPRFHSGKNEVYKRQH